MSTHFHQSIFFRINLTQPFHITGNTPLSKGSTRQTFKYNSPANLDKLVFHAVGMSNDICVKFVHQYSKDAYIKCTMLGFAPAFQGFESLAGGWYMVVMDFIDDTWTSGGFKFKISFSTEVRERLTSLHQVGYVHGEEKWLAGNHAAWLWLGWYDWWDMNVNITEVRWPDGAIDKQSVLAEHDMAVIAYMFDDSPPVASQAWFVK